MSHYKPEQSLGFVLNDVARLMRRNFNRRVLDLDLTQAQWQALAHISRNQGMKQSQLADILEVQPISVGRLIDRMETSGWIERRPDPTDRRAINLYLTEKAEPILTKMQKHGTALRMQALNGIPEEEREIMLRALLTMRKNLIGEEGQNNE
ncbi:MAG TPA: MarR family transcriptional regulator [Alphaproteobacteria bacterium]|nr:MarR family transcriptional regulator [Alphaproteobacteria bacterium]